MRRRLFLQSGSATAVLSLVGCGGGGGELAGSSVAGAANPELTSANLDGPSAASASSLQRPAAPARAASLGTSGPSYPFGARAERYVAGTLPTQSPSTMDAVLTRHYDAWKAASVVSADQVAPGGHAVQFSDKNCLAVSEGMGYGMLLTVLFAGHDPQAQSLFDGMLAVVRARPAYATGHKALMEWRLYANGTSGGEGWNAMDGDLDIAMALLMADRQWGSGGSWNYRQEAIATIDAMKAWNMKPNGTTKGLPSPENNRTSDYMIGHFRAFHAATGDPLWELAIDKAHKIIDKLQQEYSPGIGLLPDFVVNADSWPAPSPGFIGDGNDKEGYYWWNGCRNPWRFASDYLLSGDSRFAEVTGRMIDFFQSSSGGDPVKIGTGYALDGTVLTGGNSPAYSGPICAGACVDARFQTFLDAMWDWNATHLTTGYYDGEIQLLSMVVASGNWWSPAR